MKTQMSKWMKGIIFALVVCMLPTSMAYATENSGTTTNSDTAGTDGEITWKIVGDTLTLSAADGTDGEMSDYTSNAEAPWTATTKFSAVKNIVVDDTVTKLGTRAFAEISDVKVETMKIGKKVETIPTEFVLDAKIDKVIMQDGVKTLEANAFMNSVIKEVVIPKSVTSIDITEFCTIADGVSTYLQRVYGYSDSKAETFVETFNKCVTETRKDGKCSHGKIVAICEDDGSTSKTAFIEFVTIDAKGYSLVINENYMSKEVAYEVDSETGKAFRRMEEDELKAVLKKFTTKYEEKELYPLDITLYSYGEAVENKKLTINLPIPEKWKTYKKDIKIITIGDKDAIEVVTHKIVTKEGVEYLSFEPPHFSPYAVYLDSDVLTNADEEESSSTGTGESNSSEPTSSENKNSESTSGGSSTEKDEDSKLDDTPKTGGNFALVMGVIICLVMFGVGAIICSVKMKRR